MIVDALPAGPAWPRPGLHEGNGKVGAAAQYADRNRPLPRFGRAYLYLAVLVVMLLGAGGSATAADGEALFVTCTACHGSDAAGNPALGSPALAGQLEIYLKRQLHMFRRDIRGTAEGDIYGAQMAPFAKQLADDEAINTLSAWLSTLPLPASATVAPEGADAGRGQSLYNGNCGACHGGSGEGNAALKAPRLAGLDTAYLRRQFEYFQSGVRGGNPRDRLGRQMASMAATLPDEAALDDILAYLAGLASAGDPGAAGK